MKQYTRWNKFWDTLEKYENFFFGVILSAGMILVQLKRYWLGITLMIISMLSMFLHLRRENQNRETSNAR